MSVIMLRADTLEVSSVAFDQSPIVARGMLEVSTIPPKRYRWVSRVASSSPCIVAESILRAACIKEGQRITFFSSQAVGAK